MIRKIALFAIVCCFAHMSLAFEYRLPQAVVNFMASKEMRNHHFVWHNVRDMWNLLSQEDRQKITDLGWAPPRPSQAYGPNGESIVLEDNGSGEDFLYMHRNMIKQANEIAKSVCPEARVVGFKNIPAPGDKQFPVPPVYSVPGDDFVPTDQGVKDCKTDDFYWNTLKPQEDKFNDPEYLRGLSLGQFGARIEFTVHNWLHFRYSSNSKLGFRPQPLDVPVPEIDEMWDDPKYNWLADFYSAHVNRLFWKIHGWVDDKIEQWREAHGLEEVPWREDVWETGMQENIPKLENIGEHDHHNGRLLMGDHDNLEEVIKILVASGHCRSFYPSSVKFESEL